MKSKLRLNASDFSIIYSTPHFANTMLLQYLNYFSQNALKCLLIGQCYFLSVQTNAKKSGEMCYLLY